MSYQTMDHARRVDENNAAALQISREERTPGPVNSASAANTPRAIGRLLRRPEVERETGLSCSTIYRLMDAGIFPRPLRTGRRMVAWASDEIDAWKLSRPVADPTEV